MCSFAFAFGMGLVCYFIGFFFGRVARKFSRNKNETGDGAEFFSIPADETFLVDVKTGEYSFRGDLVKKHGRNEVFRMLAYGELVHEKKWLEMKKKNECKTYDDVVKREG